MLGELWWFLRFTLEAIVELAPWFIAAIVLGVLIQHLNLDMLAKRGFSRHGVLGVVLAAAVGALSPFCSFTVIPLISRLLRAGVPLSVIMAFWMASPSMDPEIFALSAAALGTDVAVARLLGAIVLSVGSGLVVLFIERRGGFKAVLRDSVDSTASASVSPAMSAPAVATARTSSSVAAVATVGARGQLSGPRTSFAGSPPTPAKANVDTSSCASCDDTADPSGANDDPICDQDDGRSWYQVVRQHSAGIDWRRFIRDVLRDLVVMGKWLLLAIVAQGVIVRYLPQDWVTASLGTGDWWAIPLAGAVGVPLYLNGVGAIPITQGLLSQGMVPGAAVTFLLAGAITTVPAMVAVRAVARWSTFAFYVGVGFLGSILVGALAQVWL